MDTIRLRTLTWKSVLWFGKYKDYTIKQVYELNHTRYLRFIYYNYESISFIDEILDKIKIPEKYLIEKPGKNLEIHEKVNNIMLRYVYENNNQHKLTGIDKKDRKLRKIINSNANKFRNKKSYLRELNRGNLKC